MKDALKLATPYLAVIIGWLLLENGWIALGLYHLQIILWWSLDRPSRTADPAAVTPPPLWGGRWLAAGLIAAPTGLLAWFLWPVLDLDVTGWLEGHGIPVALLPVMIVWFGLLHPALEEAHWSPLRERYGAFAHVLFGAYHALVLFSLLGWPMAIGCALGLGACSALWGWMTRRSGSLAPAILFHTLADAGLILSVWLWIR